MDRCSFGEILLVEDNSADLKFMSEVLLEAGYHVRPASDGALALRSLKANLPDLVLMDVNLPDMLGTEVCRQLKSYPESQDIPVIFLSSMDDCELKVKALNAGAADFVTKPIQPEEILARINTHLNMYRLQLKIRKQSKDLEREISERKKAEILNTRFSQMLEDSLNEIYAFDSQTYGFVHSNRGGRRNLGYSQEELETMSVLDIKRDFSLESFSELVEPLRTGSQEIIVFQTLHYRKDGTTYPVEIHLQLMHESPPLFVAITLDITKRKLKDDLLRESEERFKIAIESADDCILIWDQDYNYLYANQAAIAHVGITADKVMVKNIRDGLGNVPDFMHLWMDRIDAVFASGESLRVQDEIVMDGQLVFTDSILSPLRAVDGTISSVYVVYRDITDLKNVEKELRDSHEIINRSPAVAFLWENVENWPVAFVSDNVKQILGHPAEDFLEGKVHYASLIHPDDLGRVVEEVSQYTQENDCNGFTHEPYRLITASGREVWVDDRTTFRRDSKGEITHFQGIVLDITANVNAEAERNQLESRLYQSDKMASIGQLAAGVAHEVNNPIGFISANLKTMADYVQELKQHSLDHETIDTNEDVAELFLDFEEAVSESYEGAKRVQGIVADMMGISRPGSDKVEYANINAGLDSTLNIVWYKFKHCCEVEKEFGNIPLVECFQSKINQVFLNLLVNAGHSMENQPGKIWIKTWADGDHVKISIRDNGCGVPQENISQLFDAFFTTKDVGQGTGLGLSLSYDIVHQHGGSITVESEIGHGTEFVVVLPVVWSPVNVELAMS